MRRSLTSLVSYSGLPIAPVALTVLAMPMQGPEALATRRSLPRVTGTAVWGQELKGLDGLLGPGRRRTSPTAGKTTDRKVARCSTIRVAHALTLTLAAHDVGKAIRLSLTRQMRPGRPLSSPQRRTSYERSRRTSRPRSTTPTARTHEPAPRATSSGRGASTVTGSIVRLEPGSISGPGDALPPSRKSARKTRSDQDLGRAVSGRRPNCPPAPDDWTALALAVPATGNVHRNA